VPVHRILSAGIAEADPDLHRREIPPILCLCSGPRLVRLPENFDRLRGEERGQRPEQRQSTGLSRRFP
jgi:hypothetical protein